MRKLLWRLEKQQPVLCSGRKISETAAHINLDRKGTLKSVHLDKKIPRRDGKSVICLLLAEYKVL